MQAARGCADSGSSTSEVDDVVASIDAQMVQAHMTTHRSDRDGQIAMPTQALFTASASERVLSQNLLVRGKHGKLQLDAVASQQLRSITATMATLVTAINKLTPPSV